jgi:hypothetical protein
MLAFDSTNQNDVLRKTIMVHAIGAEVVAETLPHDTIVPGTRKLNLSMCNSGTDGTVFWAYLELLRGDTALVYRDSASGFMYPGHQRLFAFDPWNASEGSYLGQYVVRVDDHIIRDTLSWRFWVFGSSACDDAQSWTRREDIALEGPWPNPCRGVATISYALPQAGPVSIKLYDLRPNGQDPGQRPTQAGSLQPDLESHRRPGQEAIGRHLLHPSQLAQLREDEEGGGCGIERTANGSHQIGGARRANAAPRRIPCPGTRPGLIASQRPLCPEFRLIFYSQPGLTCHEPLSGIAPAPENVMSIVPQLTCYCQ